jgi:hypothetical protein
MLFPCLDFMKNTEIKINREQWLANAVVQMAPLFKAQGYEVPAVRVSCGWPSSRGMSRKRRTVGECWDKSTAEDKVAQIFISPVMKDSVKVLGTLVHEVVHAVVGCKEQHNKVFGKCSRAVGLVGKLTECDAGPELQETFKTAWIPKIGEYPHAVLNPYKVKEKKQTTRLVKCECGECGYNVRVTRKWLDAAGAPLCPCNSETMGFEIPKELEKDDE